MCRGIDIYKVLVSYSLLLLHLEVPVFQRQRMSLYLALWSFSSYNWCHVLLSCWSLLLIVHLLIPTSLLHRLADVDNCGLFLDLELLLPWMDVAHIAGANPRIDGGPATHLLVQPFIEFSLVCMFLGNCLLLQLNLWLHELFVATPQL